jgi:hypothetical protein
MRHTYAFLLGALLVPTASEPVSIALGVGGKSYRSSGEGECHYAPVASYRDMRAAMWSVEYSVQGEEKDGLANVHLTAWRPLAGGPAQMSLYVRIGSVNHRIETVKGAENVGNGTLSVQPDGDGGTFTIDGKDDSGAVIKGTIRCAKFSAHEAVAG